MESDASPERHVTREEIEESLADVDGAYRRLRRIMDAWCALWFWPLTEDEITPPTLDEWYDALRMILGGDTMKASVAKKGDETLESAMTWDELGEAEYNDRVYAGAAPHGRRAGEAPMAAGLRADRRPAGLLPLGARLRLGLRRARWVRPAGRKPALGAARSRTSRRCWPRATRGGSLKVKATQARRRRAARCDAEIPGISELVVDGTADVVVTSAASSDLRSCTRIWTGCSQTSIAASWSRPGATRSVSGVYAR